RFTATGLIHHSNAGSQYTSLAFSQELADAAIAGSIGTVGDALDNALMESTIGLYKTEVIHPRPRTWTSRSEVERQTARWVAWYNANRLHSSIGYRTPLEAENDYRQATTAAPAPDVA
ncbi:MAG TPA: integrase core domain-containing protein, partial [Lapillicoccus sp.]|uniref:integrase core domain-containing protein n=1 Tax=Lapillicoccus sp. TaxID=1909287 RepID=UPI002F949BDC